MSKAIIKRYDFRLSVEAVNVWKDMTQLTGILERGAMFFTQARKNLLAGAAILHKISEEKLWEGTYSSFSEYLGEACQISDSLASKLIRVYTYFVLEGKVSMKKIERVDIERLYLVIPLNDTLTEKVEKALILSRSDLRLELNEQKAGLHECEWFELHIRQCKMCGVRERLSL